MYHQFLFVEHMKNQSMELCCKMQSNIQKYRLLNKSGHSNTGLSM